MNINIYITLYSNIVIAFIQDQKCGNPSAFAQINRSTNCCVFILNNKRSREITLLTKVPLVKAMAFPVVMYGCESWTIKKAEAQRIDAFELWCWRRLLSVPWTVRRSNWSILKEICPRCSLEIWMLKLKLQYFGHLI